MTDSRSGYQWIIIWLFRLVDFCFSVDLSAEWADAGLPVESVPDELAKCERDRISFDRGESFDGVCRP